MNRDLIKQQAKALHEALFGPNPIPYPPEIIADEIVDEDADFRDRFMCNTSLPRHVVRELCGIDLGLAYQDHRYGSGDGFGFTECERDEYDFDSLMSDGGDDAWVFSGAWHGADDKNGMIVLGFSGLDGIERLLMKYHEAPHGLRVMPSTIYEIVDRNYGKEEWIDEYRELVSARAFALKEREELEQVAAHQPAKRQAPRL